MVSKVTADLNGLPKKTPAQVCTWRGSARSIDFVKWGGAHKLTVGSANITNENDKGGPFNL